MWFVKFLRALHPLSPKRSCGTDVIKTTNKNKSFLSTNDKQTLTIVFLGKDGTEIDGGTIVVNLLVEL